MAPSRLETFLESSVARVRTRIGGPLASVSAALRAGVRAVWRPFDQGDGADTARGRGVPSESDGAAPDGQRVSGSGAGGQRRAVDSATVDSDTGRGVEGRPADETVAADADAGDVLSGEYSLGPPVTRPPRESRRVGYYGEQFDCTSVASRNGRWRVAWGPPVDGGAESNERVFLLQYEARQSTVAAVGVESCAVGDDGTVAVAESDGDGDDSVSRLRVFSATGETVLDRGFDAEIRAVAVAGDREPTVVGAGLRSPDRLVVFDGGTGADRLIDRLDVEPDAIEFRESGGERWVVVNAPAQPTPAVAVRVRDGTVARHR